MVSFPEHSLPSIPSCALTLAISGLLPKSHIPRCPVDFWALHLEGRASHPEQYLQLLPCAHFPWISSGFPSQTQRLLLPETAGIFPSFQEINKLPPSKGLRGIVLVFVGHIWFLRQILSCCGWSCTRFTTFATSENHSQITGHARLTPDPHYHFLTLPIVKSGWGLAWWIST